MTKNQIEYLKLRETQRNNAEVNELTRSRIGNDFAVSTMSLGETQRHNKAQELNAANQTLENVRHNINSELLTELGVHETERANRAREAETKRSNQAQESLTTTSLQQSKAYQSAQVGLGYSQVGLGYSQLSEASRANKANEAIKQQQNQEVNRANVARETEQHRANVASEQNTARRNAISTDELAEKVRHNQRQEVSMFIDTGANALSSLTKAASTIALAMP